MWGKIMKARDFFEAFDFFFSDIDKISIHVEHGDDIEISIESYFDAKRDAEWINYRVNFWTVNKKVLDVTLVEM